MYQHQHIDVKTTDNASSTDTALTHTAYSTSCRSSTEPATAAAKPVVATDALLRLGSGLGDALGVVAGASAALMPVVALAAIVALAVALRLAATAEAVAFLTAPATVVAFLRPVGATGSSVVVALRLAGWAVATHARASTRATITKLVFMITDLCREE